MILLRVVSIGRGAQCNVGERMFENLDLTDFWNNSAYALEHYVEAPLTDAMVASAEGELACKLPFAYVALMKRQNGGAPRRSNHRTKQRTSWASDHIAIKTISGIGSACPRSLCGRYGTRFWVKEWEYPDIGVYFATCPSGGHDMLCLDYRECGPGGEPAVVHVDQEFDFAITPVAPNFESFVRGLEGDDAFGNT